MCYLLETKKEEGMDVKSLRNLKWIMISVFNEADEKGRWRNSKFYQFLPFFGKNVDFYSFPIQDTFPSDQISLGRPSFPSKCVR